MENELLNNIIYDKIKVSVRQRIFNFFYSIGIIKSSNWIFGGK